MSASSVVTPQSVSVEGRTNLVLLLLGLEALLVEDELLVHEQVVLDALELEQTQPGLVVRHNGGQSVGRLGSALLLALADRCGRWRLVLFLLLVLVARRERERMCL